MIPLRPQKDVTVHADDSIESARRLKSFSYGRWIKAGTVFVAGALAFVVLKASGAFSVIADWFLGDADIQHTDSKNAQTLVKSEKTSSKITESPVVFSKTGEDLSSELSSMFDLRRTGKILLARFNELHVDKETNPLRKRIKKLEGSKHPELFRAIPPVSVSNILTISKSISKEKKVVVLTSEMLSATDMDCGDSSSIFQVSDVRNGQFEFKNISGTPITQFTQQDIKKGQVVFVHDSSSIESLNRDISKRKEDKNAKQKYPAIASSYRVRVINGNSNTTFIPASIVFCDHYEKDISRIYGPCFSSSNRNQLAVTALTDGKFVVVWSDDRHGGGVYGQLFDPSGTIYGGEFQTTNIYQMSRMYDVYNYYQGNPSVAALSDGKFVVIWRSSWEKHVKGSYVSTFEIFGQLFNSNGTECDNAFQVSTSTQIYRGLPAIAAFPDGKFVIAWKGYRQESYFYDKVSSHGIFMQLFNPSGTKYGSELQANIYNITYNMDCYQDDPTIKVLTNGKFVVAWYRKWWAGGVDSGIYGQLFNPSGTKYGSEFKASTHYMYYNQCDQNEPAITALTDGKFIIAWYSSGSDGFGIYGQLFNPSGTKHGAGFKIKNIYGYRSNPVITALTDGKFVLLWHSTGNDGYSGIYGQLFNPSDTKYDGEFNISIYPHDYIYDRRSYPVIATLADGKFFVAWNSNSGSGIYGRIFKINLTSSITHMFKLTGLIGGSCALLISGGFFAYKKRCKKTEMLPHSVRTMKFFASTPRALSQFSVLSQKERQEKSLTLPESELGHKALKTECLSPK